MGRCSAPGNLFAALVLTFFEKFKSLISYLRDSNALDDLAKHMKDAGSPGLSSAVRSMRLANIAEWRWSTLGRVCKAVSRMIESLSDHFEPAWLGKSKDKKEGVQCADRVAWRMVVASRSLYSVAVPLD